MKDKKYILYIIFLILIISINNSKLTTIYLDDTTVNRTFITNNFNSYLNKITWV